MEKPPARERVCASCDIPFVPPPSHRSPKCVRCLAEMREDYKAVNRFEMDFAEYRRKWRNPKRLEEVVERPLMLGAVPIGGKVFFWKGEPYIAARHREAVKAIL